MRLLLLFSLVLISFNNHAQDYVDLVKVSYSEGFNADFENGSGQTRVTNFDLNSTLPVVINPSNTLITGFDFGLTTLGLETNAPDTHLYTSTLKIGWAKTFNERWSSTLVFLPKVASDYNDIDGSDFYFGGFGVLKYQRKENLMYRFGLYASTEAFGLFAAPIFGVYYTSPNQLFEMNLSLPVAADLNYIVGRNLKVGADYIGLGRSYSLTINNVKDTYVQQNSLEFATYLEKAFIEQSLLIRLKAGYSTNVYEQYGIDERIDLGLVLFRFGDDRTQLNQNISSAPFLRIEAIYRFYINKKAVD